MKNAIATFIKEHPFLTYWIIGSACEAVVGVFQAITGNYPPEKEVTTSDSPKLEVEIKKPESEEVTGEVVDSDMVEYQGPEVAA